MNDHLSLIRKYMEIVFAEEGVTFVPISDKDSHHANVRLTAQEWQALKEIEAEVVAWLHD